MQEAITLANHAAHPQPDDDVLTLGNEPTSHGRGSAAAGAHASPMGPTVRVFEPSLSSNSRPAAAIDQERRLRLTQCALDYLRRLRNPPLKRRFDVVEVLLGDGKVREIRHLPTTFPMSRPHRYG